jgi:hypothetical protein
MRRSVLWMLALVAASPTNPQAEDRRGGSSDPPYKWERLPVVVRLYASGDVPAAPPRALSVATTILEDAAVPVTWISCGLERHPEPCNSLLTSTDLLLRMVRSTDDSNRHWHALGFSLIDRQQHAGVLATVYVDQVASLARESGVDESLLLGRAIAHEIGHLLIGTNQHSIKGVMRARWTRQDLRRGSPDQWRFTRADVMAMRKRVEPPLMASR